MEKRLIILMFLSLSCWIICRKCKDFDRKFCPVFWVGKFFGNIVEKILKIKKFFGASKKFWNLEKFLGWKILQKMGNFWKNFGVWKSWKIGWFFGGWELENFWGFCDGAMGELKWGWRGYGFLYFWCFLEFLVFWWCLIYMCEGINFFFCGYMWNYWRNG